MAEITAELVKPRECEGCEISGGVVGSCALVNAITEGMSPDARIQVVTFLQQPRGEGITQADVLDDIGSGSKNLQPPFAKVMAQLQGHPLMLGVIRDTGLRGSKQYYLEDELVEAACSSVTGEARTQAEAALSMVAWIESFFSHRPYKEFIVRAIHDTASPLTMRLNGKEKLGIKPLTGLYESGVEFAQEHEAPIKGQTQRPRTLVTVSAQTRESIRKHALEASNWENRLESSELTDDGILVTNHVIDYLRGIGGLPVLTGCSLQDLLIIRDKISPKKIGHKDGQSAVLARARQTTMRLDKILNFWLPYHVPLNYLR